jgi:hypothetical protein
MRFYEDTLVRHAVGVEGPDDLGQALDRTFEG